MLSFIAVAWDEGSETQKSFAEHLIMLARPAREVAGHELKFPGFALYDLNTKKTGANIHSFSNSTGAVYGRIHKNDNTKANFDAKESDKITKTTGEHLAINYWGSYVAFLKTQNAVHIITDPTSNIQCFFTQINDVSIIFSNLEILRNIYNYNFTFNLKFLSALIVYDKINNGETGFNEIHEILGGQRLTIAGSVISKEYTWDPRAIAKNTADFPNRESAELLREVTTYCISKAASDYNKIILDLSGGLDSSIVLACLSLAKESQSTIPVHYISEAGDVSEVHYARTMAQHVEHSLIERHMAREIRLPSPFEHPLTPRPYRYFLNTHDNAASIALAQEVGADAFFTGKGGDHLFYQTKTNLTFADFVHNNGIFSTSALSHLIDAARLSETSVWRTILDTFATTWRPSSGSRSRLEMYINTLNRELYENLDLAYITHDWCKDRRGIPPAKFRQIEMLLHMVHFREPFGRTSHADVVHPIISQPIIELCLRLPTYRLSLGGIDRGLAREAFAQLLPEKIRVRTTKGATTKHHIERIEKNKLQISNALLDGYLVSNGLLNKKALENYIFSDEFKFGSSGVRLLPIYAIECWLQSWMIELA